MSETITQSAEEFYKDGVYRFPFVGLDDTPGGSNLGRIEWNIEPIWTLVPDEELGPGEDHYMIARLLVWARQTRDERYRDKVFEISLRSEAISGHSHSRYQSFTDYVWLVAGCREHGNVVLSAYPPNGLSVLEIRPHSSLAIDVLFATEGK